METRPQYENYSKNVRGSIWNRWEPHIHVPGTILNDEYKSPDPIEEFITLIEQSDPPIRCLGITDYYSLDRYELIAQKKKENRIPSVEMIFPNVELRFSIGTTKGSGINAHLLISPEDPNHLEEARRFLRKLTFTYRENVFNCDNADLIKLGKAFDRSIVDERKALETGTNQFKANFDQLRTLIKDHVWAQKNILLGIAGSNKDGTAVLQADSSFAALRNELERCAHIIFSSTPKQREFWLGYGTATKFQLEEKWGGCKPCLHGSDAHSFEKVGKPALDRYSWIKGDTTFESLRQVCIEPEGRCFIGELPPSGGLSSHSITHVRVHNAPWLQTPELPINPGIIAIIGARGSGKTALADFIAAGGLAFTEHISDRSFIRRAGNLIEDESVTIEWETGEATNTTIKYAESEDLFDSPKVQYLSQQFVEELCSSEGMSDKLMDEIERVIYMAHHIDDRMGADSFQELLELRSSLSRNERGRQEDNLFHISEAILGEQEKRDSLPSLEKQLTEKEKELLNNRAARQKLVRAGEVERLKHHEAVSNSLDKVRANLDAVKRQQIALKNLKGEIDSLQKNGLPAHLLKLKENFKETALTTDQWNNFKLIFAGDVGKLLDEQMDKVSAQITAIAGTLITWDKGKPEQSLIPIGQDLNSQSVNMLTAELNRLQFLVGIDKDNSDKYSRLSQQIGKDEGFIEKLKGSVKDAREASDIIQKLMDDRKQTYRNIFEAIIEEEIELTSLYHPLMERLNEDVGILNKLSFQVKRYADIEAWAERGETLMDLRKVGAFKGKGALLAAIKEELENAWVGGTSDDVAEALDDFRKKYSKDIIDHAQVERIDRANYRQWAKKIAEWLYSTNHITVRYSVQYDKVEIKQLSPGTRGIVLLLLYLSIDKDDNRPLIIDQPEENLDPKSIYDELVTRFKAAKLRRQIIIVTHNANLVVNTDADQIIVASCGDHRPNQLPLITYSSGGLENPEIRQKVCEILEGGETAFRERAKRLRVTL